MTSQRRPGCTGTPFIIVNTVVGSLAAYGLGGLNAEGGAIVLNTMLVALQSLVSTQFQIACVLLTPNQDMVRPLICLALREAGCACCITLASKQLPGLLGRSCRTPAWQQEAMHVTSQRAHSHHAHSQQQQSQRGSSPEAHPGLLPARRLS